MSRSYWRVSPAFWGDEKAVTWSDDARLVALYLLTCPHRTAEGLFRLPMGYAVTDLGWTPQRFQKAFETLLDGFVEYDEHCSVVLIVNALAYQSPENPNQVTGAITRLTDLPQTYLLKRLYEQATFHCPTFAETLAEAFGNRFETLSKPPALTPAPALTPTPTNTPPAKAGIARAQFEAFWETYPRHTAKGDAEKAWDKALKKTPAIVIMSGLAAHLPAWATYEKRFIPHASTWLNQARWQDDPPEPDAQGYRPDPEAEAAYLSQRIAGVVG